MMQKLLLLALAGAMGTLARYGLSAAVHRWLGGPSPWGTFAVNVVGCFAFGVISAMAVDRLAINGHAQLILLVGFMGAFTTFSTFICDTGQMMEKARWLHASGNMLIHNAAGMAVFFLGLALGRTGLGA